MHLAKLLWALRYAPAVPEWGSWLGHHHGRAQSAETALSAAEEQPLAFHKGERRCYGTGSLVTSVAWHIHKGNIWRVVEKVSLRQCVCWGMPGLKASRWRISRAEGTVEMQNSSVILRLLGSYDVQWKACLDDFCPLQLKMTIVYQGSRTIFSQPFRKIILKRPLLCVLAYVLYCSCRNYGTLIHWSTFNLTAVALMLDWT